MLIRAAFWIGVVALLMPHEPNLGYGRPNAQWWPGAALSWMDATVGAPNKICSEGAACRTVLENAGSAGENLAQNIAVHGISEAKAEIEQAERERAAHAE